MPKIQLDMSAMDMIMVMSEGNPGALKVLMESLDKVPEVDPDDVFGPWGLMMHLDSLGIYGERIWMLYKDLCGENITNTIAMARAWQLGIVRESDLKDAINGLTIFNVSDIIEKVKERLPSFALNQEEFEEEIVPFNSSKKDFIPAWMQRPESDYSSLFRNN
jgi:hypothetical protein